MHLMATATRGPRSPLPGSEGSRFPRTTVVAANAVVLCLLVGGVFAYATSKDNGTRVRNSFLVATAPVEIFTSPPSQTPADFLAETLPAPAYLDAAVAKLLPDEMRASLSALEQSLVLARHLIANKRRGKAIQSNVRETYELIRNSGRGYCADYSQVFTALALTAGIPVREWGLRFKGFGRGHAFNEIYDRTLGKWVFIDSYHSLYVVDRSNAEPLSVMELQNRLINDGEMVSYAFVPIDIQKYRFDADIEANQYYAQTAAKFYLFWGNNVFSYDAHPVVRALAPWSRSLEIMGAIVAGVHPKIRVLQRPENTAYLSRLQYIRYGLVAALVFAAMLVLNLCREASRCFQRRHD